MNLFDLTGRTALVTGSSRGLGRAMAEGLAAAGARVVINGVDAARVEAYAIIGGTAAQFGAARAKYADVFIKDRVGIVRRPSRHPQNGQGAERFV